MYCQKCGREADSNGEFCLWCGANFREFPPVPLIFVGASKTVANPTPAEVGVTPTPKAVISGVPVKIIKAGFILTVAIPAAGFAFGYFVVSGLPPAEAGFVVGAAVYLSSFITGRIIQWMVK